MRRFLVFAVCLLAAGTGLRAQDPDADRISLELLLGRGGWYVLDFIEKFSNVVSEETYIQDSSVPMQSAALPNLPGLPRVPGGASGPAVPRYRNLKADFLLVSVSSAQNWVPFRDVFEVDGQPIRDRDSRLAKLFLKPSEKTVEQVNRIQDESARYNLGNMRRTINNPVLGIVILQADFQPRFRYSLGKMDPKVGPGVWIIDYKEEARPSFIRGRSDLDLFAHGRLWIEADTGRLDENRSPAGTAHLAPGSRRRSVSTTGSASPCRMKCRKNTNSTTARASPPSRPTIGSGDSTCRPRTPSRTRRSRIERVLQLIGDRAVLDGAPPQPPLQHVTRFLEHSTRRDVPRKGNGVDARQPMRRDRIFGQRHERFRRDPRPQNGSPSQ